MTGYKPSCLAHIYGYECSNEPKSVLKLLDFRFGLYCRAASKLVSIRKLLMELAQFSYGN